MNERLATELLERIELEKARLLQYSEPDVSRHPAPGKWSAKQILGHLVDSATNNHQRFVRSVGSGTLEFPGYEADLWVHIHRYDDAIWLELVQLWAQFNKYLAHAIQHLSAEALNSRVSVGGAEPVSLEFLIEDYSRHMQHHLSQIGDLCGR